MATRKQANQARYLTGMSCLAVMLLVAPAVRAQGSAEADTLYSQAGDLMKEKRFAEACPKLETSLRLDPGIGTGIRLGFCYEQLGRLASAWSAYNDAEALARRVSDKRADEAAGRAKALEPRLSRLVITSKSLAPGQVVKRDGKPVDPGLYGVGVPVDPGEHTVEASAPRRHTWVSKFTTEGLGVKTVEVPPLAERPVDAASSAAPFWTGQRIAGAVVGGAGLVAVAVGLGFGASAKSTYNDSLKSCLPNDPTQCYAQGVALRNQAYQVGNMATPIFIAGAVGLGAGTIVILTAPSGARVQVQPTAGPTSGGLTFNGAW